MKRWLAALLLFLCACAAPVKTEPAVLASLEPTALPTAVQTPTPSFSPSPAPTSEPTAIPTPEPTPVRLLGDRFADMFSDVPIKTETSYKSKNIGIELRTVQLLNAYGRRRLVYYVADIYVQDVTLIRTEPAVDFTGRDMIAPEIIVERVGALLAINGDTFGRTHRGLVIRNGVLYRNLRINEKDLCVLYRDGRMETFAYNGYTMQTVIDSDPWQVWNFGPQLLDRDGKAITDFSYEDERLWIAHPRTAIGYYEPGHYCFVVVDGRQPDFSEGINLVNFAKLMEDLGCVRAYNLDGGGSSVLFWDGKLINRRSDSTRTNSDIIYLLPEE